MGWNRYIPIPSRVSCHPDWYSQDILDKSYIIYLVTFGFFIPLVTIVFSYAGIYRYIQRGYSAESCVIRLDIFTRQCLFFLAFE